MEPTYHCSFDGQTCGPYTKVEIQQFLESGHLPPMTSVWNSHTQKWMTIHQFLTGITLLPLHDGEPRANEHKLTTPPINDGNRINEPVHFNKKIPDNNESYFQHKKHGKSTASPKPQKNISFDAGNPHENCIETDDHPNSIHTLVNPRELSTPFQSISQSSNHNLKSAFHEGLDWMGNAAATDYPQQNRSTVLCIFSWAVRVISSICMLFLLYVLFIILSLIIS